LARWHDGTTDYITLSLTGLIVGGLGQHFRLKTDVAKLSRLLISNEDRMIERHIRGRDHPMTSEDLAICQRVLDCGDGRISA
jgi:hypothetical protein